MPSLTLVEAAKVQQNPLISGVIESIVTVNQMYRFLPFDQIVGNALLYTRENAIAGVAPVGIGGGSNVVPAAAKTSATFTPVTTPIKAIIGDALVDHFIQTTLGTQNDQKGVQVASKAKAMGREFQRQFILGDSTVDPLEFDGMQKLIPASQTKDYASANYSFEMLDEMISQVKSKDGQVDYLAMPDEAIRKHMALLRALGGASINEVRTMPDGSQIQLYRGIPMFRNDWIPVAGTTDRLSDIYAGNFDDGSRKVGVAGLTSQVNSGVFVTEVGEAELSNDTITRVRFYAGLALFSELAAFRGRNVRINALA